MSDTLDLDDFASSNSGRPSRFYVGLNAGTLVAGRGIFSEIDDSEFNAHRHF